MLEHQQLYTMFPFHLSYAMPLTLNLLERLVKTTITAYYSDSVGISLAWTDQASELHSCKVGAFTPMFFMSNIFASCTSGVAAAVASVMTVTDW